MPLAGLVSQEILGRASVAALSGFHVLVVASELYILMETGHSSRTLEISLVELSLFLLFESFAVLLFVPPRLIMVLLEDGRHSATAVAPRPLVALSGSHQIVVGVPRRCKKLCHSFISSQWPCCISLLFCRLSPFNGRRHVLWLFDDSLLTPIDLVVLQSFKQPALRLVQRL